MATFSSEEFGKADFVLLEDLSTEAFMDNLKLRYKKGKIYTYIGEVVVSVNPYRPLVIYDKEYVQVSQFDLDCLRSNESYIINTQNNSVSQMDM